MLESLNYSFRNPKNIIWVIYRIKQLRNYKRNHGVLRGTQLDKQRWRARLGILRVKVQIKYLPDGNINSHSYNLEPRLLLLHTLAAGYSHIGQVFRFCPTWTVPHLTVYWRYNCRKIFQLWFANKMGLCRTFITKQDRTWLNFLMNVQRVGPRSHLIR